MGIQAITASDSLRDVPGDVRGKKILVVDDSMEIRMILKHFLRSLGTEVVEAYDGIDALEKILLMPFDLVLMDIQMPRMDGNQVKERLNAIHCEIPVIAVTANFSHEEVRQYQRAGFVSILGKPFDRSDLVRLVVDSLTARFRPAKPLAVP